MTNLLTIHSALSGRSIAELEEHFAGRGYGDLKKELAEVVTDFVTPVRARTQELLDDPAELERVLAAGAARAREVAAARSPRPTTGSASWPRRAASHERRHVRPRGGRAAAGEHGARHRRPDPGAVGPAAGRLAVEGRATRRPAWCRRT